MENTYPKLRALMWHVLEPWTTNVDRILFDVSKSVTHKWGAE